MGDITYQVVIEGIRPLLLHNGQLADPMNEWTRLLKASSKKRNKGDDDHAETARVEFQGSLYHSPKLGPYLPVDNLQAALEKGAKKRKLGVEFKSLVNVVPPEDGEDGYKLEYKGPRDRDALWADPKFRLIKGVRVTQSRVMRCRPRFPAGWRVTFDVEVLDGGVSDAQLKQAIEDAGIYGGAGDWRPRYGRFLLSSLKRK